MRIIGTILASGLLLALGGCGEPPEVPPERVVATAVPQAPPGISLSVARVQLPAVSGRPGVAYFTISQSSGPPRTVAGVAVELAGRSEMHESMRNGEAMTMQPVEAVQLESGQSVEFAPGGKHVMLFDLDPKLRFEDSVELTVTFDGGDKATAQARVSTVNDMESMN